MTDEINDDAMEKVSPVETDVTKPANDFTLYTTETLSVGDTVHTDLHGYFKVVDGGRNDTYFLKGITEAEATEPIHHLEKYGLDYR
jgi:hypothetical protein